MLLLALLASLGEGSPLPSSLISLWRSVFYQEAMPSSRRSGAWAGRRPIAPAGAPGAPASAPPTPPTSSASSRPRCSLKGAREGWSFGFGLGSLILQDWQYILVRPIEAWGENSPGKLGLLQGLSHHFPEFPNVSLEVGKRGAAKFPLFHSQVNFKSPLFGRDLSAGRTRTWPSRRGRGAPGWPSWPPS